MTERELQDAVVEAAGLLGYLAFHARPAVSRKGWRTPVAYDGAGFPDCVLVGRGRVLWLEFKSDRGRLSPEQQGWADALAAAGEEWVCVRPADWLSGAVNRLLLGSAGEAAAA